MAPPSAAYEPSLAGMAKRVDELAPPSTPEFFDHEIRECGVLPEHPVNSVKVARTTDDKLHVIADIGTAASNNKKQITFVIVQTDDGPRILDASDKNIPSLREHVEKRLNVLLAVEADRVAAASFVRQIIEKPTADMYAPSLVAFGGLPTPKPQQVISVKSGLYEANRTVITATLGDNGIGHYIVEQTDKGPRIWDAYTSKAQGSLRVALADAHEKREARPLEDQEAVAFVQKLFASYVNPKLKSGETPLGAGLAELISVDAQLTDGVPYVNGDIVCGCQDSENFSVESVKAASRDGQMVHVEANFHVFQDPHYARHQTYVIVKTRDGLRIFDVIEENRGSLRNQLRQVIAEAYLQ